MPSQTQAFTVALPTTTSITDDDIPPTPPPKSPSAKYLSSFRRFASTRASHSHSQSSQSRQSVSMSSEISSSEDSVPVMTPPDNSPGFVGNGAGGPLPRMRTPSTHSQSSNRPGSVINVPWPSISPKKNQGSLSRATSFAEKIFRGRKKSNTSIQFDATERMSGVEPLPSFNVIPELPNVFPPSPSLHELVLAAPDTDAETSFDSSLQPPPSTPPQASTRVSWMSTSTTSNDSSLIRSPLFDKDMFDAFPSVPQNVPSPATRSAIAGAGHTHSKQGSQNGSILRRTTSVSSTSTLGPHTIYREATDLL
jgi:hypothetical protein